MANLSANEQSFITMMSKSDEHTRRGFELILQRSAPLRYLDALLDAGMFAPSKNPAPVPAHPEGYVRLPYWAALDYLVACAKLAGDTDDAELTEKLLNIVRTVSLGSPSNGARDNFHTFRKFAEILGLLPTISIRPKDLTLVRHWLNTKFDRFMVAVALDEGVLVRFLASKEPTDRRKAVQVVSYCTAIQWQPSALFQDTVEPIAVVEAYWLEKLINRHAASLGNADVGREAARLFARRVDKVFTRGPVAEYSYVRRPSVGDDGQNRGVANVEDCVVEGLRDVLLAWSEVDGPAASAFVYTLLRSRNQMLRRVGIFVLGQRWVHLQDIYLRIAKPELFDWGHLHELYSLLRLRFEDFSQAQKSATFEAIQQIPEPTGDNATERRERAQYRWLSAVAGTTHEAAARRLEELTAKYGPLRERADQLFVIDSDWGSSGPSPFSARELIAFAEDGDVVARLSALKPNRAGQGSTRPALVDELERAVAAAPDPFARVLETFLGAPCEYQCGLVNGYLRLWRESKTHGASSGWDDRVWQRLFSFFDRLLQDPTFWETGDGRELRATHRRIGDGVAQLLQEGTRDENRAYPAALLPRSWALIRVLLEHGEAVPEPSEDPMTQAINSPRGRALEAAFSHVRRHCRLADKETGSHAAAWAEAQGLFEGELALCSGYNFEFSTLCGAYLRDLEYFDVDWLENHIVGIFPRDQPLNFGCALSGLAYAGANRSTYRLLRDAGVMDAALRFEIKGQHGREKLLERLTLGYLWEEETLDGDRFTYLFDAGREEDFMSVNFFLWSVRGESLESGQVERIVSYWQRCVDWARTCSTPPSRLLGDLSRLAPFLESAAGGSRELLLAVAPHVDVHRNPYEFLDELRRLVERYPAEVCSVLAAFVDAHEPFHDYRDTMRNLVSRLAERGLRKEAIGFCDKLRAMPGLAELFRELTA